LPEDERFEKLPAVARNAILDLEELTQEDLEHFLKCYQNSPKRHGSM
jgi:hypothetical protein